MRYDYDALLNKLPEDRWISRKELQDAWGLTTSTRKTRLSWLIKYGYIVTRGHTSSIQYKKTKAKAKAKTKAKTKTKTKTNITPSSKTLDELINAAVNVGTENELLRKTLIEVQTAINKVLESGK